MSLSVRERISRPGAGNLVLLIPFTPLSNVTHFQSTVSWETKIVEKPKRLSLNPPFRSWPGTSSSAVSSISTAWQLLLFSYAEISPGCATEKRPCNSAGSLLSCCGPSSPVRSSPALPMLPIAPKRFPLRQTLVSRQAAKREPHPDSKFRRASL